MKFDYSLKSEFKKAFSGKSFEMNDVKNFLEPYFEWNEEKEMERAKTTHARKFIQSFKDGEGVREALAYNSADQDETEQVSYNFFEYCEEEEVLKRQEISLEIKIAGLFKTKSRVARRRFILTNQMTIFDFIGDSGVNAKRKEAN